MQYDYTTNDHGTKFVSIGNLPASNVGIIIGEEEEVYVSPFGKRYKMFNQFTVESEKKQLSKILQWEIPVCTVKINTTAYGGYCVSHMNASIFIETKDEAIDKARQIIGAVIDGYYVTK
jgi:hypothetical protein